MKNLRKIMLVLLCSCIFVLLPEPAKAAETDINEGVISDGDEMGVGIISFSDTQSVLNLKASSYSGGNGSVMEDGVRLRKKPSLSSTIIELMYTGEAVLIDYTISYENGNSEWYYIKRLKTGRCGWVYKKYILEWD